jgi:hypothetical protein
LWDAKTPERRKNETEKAKTSGDQKESARQETKNGGDKSHFFEK